MVSVRRPVDKKWRISAVFGSINPKLRDGMPHKGTDFACPVGTPVRACFDGVIALMKDEQEGTDKQKRAGNRLAIYNKDYSALYFHLSDFNCKLSQKVKEGDIVGFSGKTGNVTGPHLHFELRELNSNKSIPCEFET